MESLRDRSLESDEPIGNLTGTYSAVPVPLALFLRLSSVSPFLSRSR